MPAPAAPTWEVARWFNAPASFSLEALRGRVVMLHAFQMLCPGCVSHGIPQAQRVATQFADAPLTVVGLHTVFEHHAVMGPAALEVFLHEYRVRFPVAIDHPAHDGSPLPLTMQAYRMRGTPTVVLIDATGRVRRHVFGAYDDLQLGRDLGALLAETSSGSSRGEPSGSQGEPMGACEDSGCSA